MNDELPPLPPLAQGLFLASEVQEYAEAYARAAIAADRARRAEPVAWVDRRNLISAAISRDRGGPFDSHIWSESKTAIHETPLYAASPPAAVPADVRAGIETMLHHYDNDPRIQCVRRWLAAAPQPGDEK